MKFYRAVATLLVIIFLSNTTLFAAGQLEIVPAEKKSETESSDQIDTTNEPALEQVTLPNGKIKNPKLPKTFSIDDSTIYLLKPIPVDSEESFEADAQSNPDLILIPVKNQDALTVELNSEQPESKKLSDKLPKSEQPTIPTIPTTTSITRSETEKPITPTTVITTVVETTPESVTSSVPEQITTPVPSTTQIPEDNIATESTSVKESTVPTPNTVVITPDTAQVPVTVEPDPSQVPVTITMTTPIEPDKKTSTTTETVNTTIDIPVTVNATAPTPVTSSTPENKTTSTTENTTSIVSTTVPTSISATTTATSPVLESDKQPVTTPETNIIESSSMMSDTVTEQQEIQTDNVTSLVDIPVQETEISARSVYEEPEIEVYSDGMDENSIQSAPLTINRKVSVKTNQYLDVYCDGRGWIYLGEINNNENVIYNSKKTENGDTKFTFRTNSPGVSVLHLYKQDIVANSWIDDYCEVTVLNEKAPNPKDRITVPITTEPITDIEVRGNTLEQSFDNSSTQIISDNFQENTEQSEQTLSDEELLNQAEQLFADKQYAEVITVLNQIKNKDENLERKLFLEAQTYEAKSDIQNIQKAYNLYKELITDFPQSKKYQQAKARMQYINNYYFSIR